uniref:Uncharacterized protein n=1 Tax=Anguilla anguilla TaxID=7936 RepID=A0A0E9T010_ANGAN
MFSFLLFYFFLYFNPLWSEFKAPVHLPEHRQRRS